MRSGKDMVVIEAHKPERSVRTVSLSCMGGCCCCCCLHSVGAVVGAVHVQHKFGGVQSRRAARLFWSMAALFSGLWVFVQPVLSRYLKYRQMGGPGYSYAYPNSEFNFLTELFSFHASYVNQGFFTWVLLTLPLCLLLSLLLTFFLSAPSESNRRLCWKMGVNIVKGTVIGLLLWTALPFALYWIFATFLWVPILIGFLLIVVFRASPRNTR